MEKYYHWTDNEAGGIFKIEVGHGNVFEYKIVSGSCVREDALISWLGFSEETRWIRDNLRGLARVNPWRPMRRTGMSGCEDIYIRSIKGDVIKRSPKVWHRSMNGKANENIMCWIKDLYDIMWSLNYSEDLSEELGVTIRDITDSVVREKEAFLENANGAHMGWGFDPNADDIIDEDDLYK